MVVSKARGIILLLVVHTSKEENGKEKSVSSRREKRIPASVLFTTPLADKQRRELERLAQKPDSEIDYSDAPENLPLPSEIQVGRFYRPIKQPVSIRIDAGVLAWFRSHGKRLPNLYEPSPPPRDANAATEGSPSAAQV